MKNLFSFDEKFGLLYEDIDLRNATFTSNKNMHNMCNTLNSQVQGIDHITSQSTVPKFGQ